MCVGKCNVPETIRYASQQTDTATQHYRGDFQREMAGYEEITLNRRILTTNEFRGLNRLHQAMKLIKDHKVSYRRAA